MQVWLGADWDSQKCVVAFEGQDGLDCACVERSPKAVADFIARWPGADVIVGIESGDPTWLKLWQQAGASVFVFNGAMARAYAESLDNSGARDDLRSARALLAMVQSKAHRTKSNVAMTASNRARCIRLEVYDAAVVDCVKYSNRLMGLLKQVHPAFAATLRQGAEPSWVLRLLDAAPTPRAWRDLPVERHEEIFKRVPRNRMREYLDALDDDYGLVDEDEELAVRERIRATITMLRAAKSVRNKAYDNLDEQSALDETAASLREIDGIGPVVATAVTVAVTHSERRTTRARDDAALLLAVAPVTRRSGVRGDAKPLVMMRRASSNLMRKLGHILGAQLVRRFRWAKAKHAYNRSRGKRCYASYRAIARSFLRVLIALRRDGTSFDEERYIAALKSKNVEWAMAL